MSIETNQGKGQLQENLLEERASLQQATFAIEGMTCASCSMRIEKGLKKVPGVADAQVNLATERGTVTYDPLQTGIAQMVQKVEAVGYKATPVKQPAAPLSPEASSNSPSTAQSSPAVIQEDALEGDVQERKAAELVRKQRLLILGIVLSFPVVILSMFFMDRFAGENILLLVLTTPVWQLLVGNFIVGHSRRYGMEAPTWIRSSRLVQRPPIS